MAELAAPKIRLLKSTVSLGCRLQLSVIADAEHKNVLAMFDAGRTSDARYFLTLEMVKYQPRIKAQIYASGKMICYGGESPQEAEVHARKFTRIIRKCGFPVQFHKFKVANMTATCQSDWKLDLNRMSTADPDRMSYIQATQMLVYRPIDSQVVLLIYNSGKIVFQKVMSVEEMNAAHEILKPLVNEYRIVQPFVNQAKKSIASPKVKNENGSPHVKQKQSRRSKKDRTEQNKQEPVTDSESSENLTVASKRYTKLNIILSDNVSQRIESLVAKLHDDSVSATKKPPSISDSEFSDAESDESMSDD